MILDIVRAVAARPLEFYAFCLLEQLGWIFQPCILLQFIILLFNTAGLFAEDPKKPADIRVGPVAPARQVRLCSILDLVSFLIYV